MSEDGFGLRLKRYAEVGGAVGGLAAKLAGQRYLGLGLDKSKHAFDLKSALGGLKGPLMKVAQILATIPDALPREYAEELAQLQSNAPPMGWPFVRRRMASELGPDWQSRYRDFPQTAIAAASLGQVHKATLHDGRTVAAKLQYADMAAAVEADLQQLKIIFQIYGRYDPAIKTEEIFREISDRLREELDYEREGRHLDYYRLMLDGQAGVQAPEKIPELSTKRLLTMTWLDGAPLMSIKEKSQEERDIVARNMFHAWYAPFYGYATIHGDPHMGNYSVRPDGSLNLLDFGCIRIFRPDFVGGVIDLYHALVSNDMELAVHAYRTWGFTDLRKDTIEVLNQWAAFLYKPLMHDQVQAIAETHNGAEGRKVVEQVHAELRKIGGVTPPREFVFMDRAAIGLGSVFTHLKAQLNWHQMFHELIADFSVEKLAARQSAALAQVGLEN
jgi:predicted unusual protein kinase regulating ubiquinone biosynthesis (AarF/ABC1/UbiB family)